MCAEHRKFMGQCDRGRPNILSRRCSGSERGDVEGDRIIECPRDNRHAKLGVTRGSGGHRHRAQVEQVAEVGVGPHGRVDADRVGIHLLDRGM
ncbi:Uncharacterised protein [Mycobacteroides abscessus subsp. abscessus]|nr:Uncharacterised protein [Mycobacteroides abscessus subsp. abscessus]